MDKSVLEKFKSDLEAAGITEFNVRVEGGNKTLANNDNSKIILQGDHIIGIEYKNNPAAGPKSNFNVVAVPYDNIDDAKAFDLTTKQLIDFCGSAGITMDDELKEFISSHGGRVSIGQRNTSGYYGEIHNEKGQVVLTTPLPGRVTLATTTDEEGTVEVDPESPIM